MTVFAILPYLYHSSCILKYNLSIHTGTCGERPCLCDGSLEYSIRVGVRRDNPVKDRIM